MQHVLMECENLLQMIRMIEVMQACQENGKRLFFSVDVNEVNIILMVLLTKIYPVVHFFFCYIFMVVFILLRQLCFYAIGYSYINW